MRRRFALLGFTAAVVLALAALSFPASAQFVSQYIARTFTSTAPSGVTGFGCRTNGCRIDFGAGLFDYMSSDGNGIIQGAGHFQADSIRTQLVTRTAAAELSLRGNVADGASAVALKLGNANALSTTGAKIAAFYNDANVTERAYIDKDGNAWLSGVVTGAAGVSTQGSLRMTTGVALPTCAPGVEGYIYRQAGSGGTNTGLVTKLCLCTSNGAVSPVYSWQNIVVGTTGTSTTCPP